MRRFDDEIDSHFKEAERQFRAFRLVVAGSFLLGATVLIALLYFLFTRF